MVIALKSYPMSCCGNEQGCARGGRCHGLACDRVGCVGKTTKRLHVCMPCETWVIFFWFETVKRHAPVVDGITTIITIAQHEQTTMPMAKLKIRPPRGRDCQPEKRLTKAD